MAQASAANSLPDTNESVAAWALRHETRRESDSMAMAAVQAFFAGAYMGTASKVQLKDVYHVYFANELPLFVTKAEIERRVGEKAAATLQKCIQDANNESSKDLKMRQLAIAAAAASAED